MEIELEINNTVNSPVEKGFFRMVADYTFKESGVGFPDDCKFSISLALVGPDDIRKLNNDFRRIDSPTDVLSFAEYPSVEEITNAASGASSRITFLGELVLCYDDIKEYAGKEGLSTEKELAKAFSHGILHLLAFEHGERMFSVQEKVAGKVLKNKGNEKDEK